MRLIEYYIAIALDYTAVALCVWGFIDALIRPAAPFTALEKLTKPAWLGILALSGFVLYFLGFMSFLGIVAAVAVGVYLADVRPAVRDMQHGGSRW